MGIDDVLDGARSRLNRLSPRAALQAQAEGALLIDTRPLTQRQAQGEIPGALVIDRNVLEWRLDPASASKIGGVSGYDQRIVVICAQGYSSSLAAASLQDIGLHRATDVEGGFEAWVSAGLPVIDPPERPTERKEPGG